MASRPKRAQRLTVYRIADARHPIFNGSGAALLGGRWNSPGTPVIYAAASYAAAMLKRLVHAGTGRLPKGQKLVVIQIPARVSVEEWSAKRLPPGWYDDDCIASRKIGDRWVKRGRSAVLIVPSAIAKYEKNVVINPSHPEFQLIVASRPEKVVWDLRLFRRA